ncbi:unnamed protein product [Amoebophrya sp. A25]|nr:unnamed protein product [Amoebophrya sp. A25]|eukprot:GSA25T00005300001.1
MAAASSSSTRVFPAALNVAAGLAGCEAGPGDARTASAPSSSACAASVFRKRWGERRRLVSGRCGPRLPFEIKNTRIFGRGGGGLLGGGTRSSASGCGYHASHVVLCESAAAAQEDGGVKYFRRAEIEKHNSVEKGVWVTYGDGVYDITGYLRSHPGGPHKVMQAAGKAIDPYWRVYQQHFRTGESLELLEMMKIGEVHPDEPEIEYDDVDPYDADPDPRSPALIYHNMKACNAELPRHLQMDRWLTPDELWFIRHHHPVPVTDKVETYKLELETPSGLNSKLSLEALKKSFEVETIPVTVQCGGNRRSQMNRVEKTSGIEWGTGGISTGAFTGVRLCDVLKTMGLSDARACAEQNVKHIVFHAKDDMSASIPIEHALDPFGEVLLAWDMNGKPLSREHGSPLRLIVPGVVGVRHVKWLTKIEGSAEEAHGPWQRGINYKGFPPSLKDFKNADPEKVLSMQKVPVQSVVCYPSEADHISVDDFPSSIGGASGAGGLGVGKLQSLIGLGRTKEQAVEEASQPPKGEKLKLELNAKGEVCVAARGWAYSGGGNGIVRVDVSSDNGKNWHTATLKDGSDQPAYRAFAWTFWEILIPLANSSDELRRKMEKGEQVVLCCKAVDSSYNVQPENPEPIWNARGLNNTSWHRVPISLISPSSKRL